MSKITRLFRRFKHRAAGFERQLRLWKRTGKVGHRKQAAKHGRAMRFLRKLIRREKRRSAERVSDQGIAFIASWEGFSPTPYNDPAGHCTVAHGKLLHYGNCTSADYERWGRVSEAEGQRMLRREVEPFASEVLRLVKVPLAQHELDALAAFAYNVGIGAFASSTLLRRLNAGNRKAVPGELSKWTLAGGRELAGLVRRRAAEARIWSDGIYPHS